MDELHSIAQSAAAHFNNRQYDKSYQLFLDIKNRSPQQTPSKEVLMNLAITDYYQNNCVDPNKLMDDLAKINTPSTSSSSTTTTTASTTDTSSSATNTPTSPKDLHQQHQHQQQQHASSDNSPPSSLANSTDALDLDNDQAMVIYNQAVLYNSLRQYGQAYNNLETLFQNILFLDDYVAIRICFLMVNIGITLQLYDKAYTVLSYLEQNFSHLYLSKDSVDTQQAGLQAINEGGGGGGSSSEQHSNNNNTHKESTESTNDDTNSTASWSNTLMTPFEYRFLIHFYKSKLYLLSNEHHHMAKEEINQAISRAMKINYKLLPACYLLKSNYYNLCGNATKTVRLLNQSKDSQQSPSTPTTSSGSSASSTTTADPAADSATMVKPLSFGIDLQIEDITPHVFFNNVGCMHFNLNRQHPSIFYLTKSLQEQSPAAGQPSLAKTEAFYNLGVILLLSGNAELAFSCLQEACMVLHNNPQVWLRLSECCILAHQKKATEEQQAHQSLTLLDKEEHSRRILLPTTSGLHQGLQIEDSDVQSTLGDESNESVRLGTLSLEFAAKCLRNAHYLQAKVLKSLKSPKTLKSAMSSSSSPPSTPPLTSTSTAPAQPSSSTSTSSSTPVSSRGGATSPSVAQLFHAHSNELMLSILASQAYIALCTNNPVVTLTATKSLLSLCDEVSASNQQQQQQTSVSGDQSSVEAINNKFRYYGHIYAAEASIMLNCPDKAISYLSPSFVDSIQDSSFQSRLNQNPITDTISPNDHRAVFYRNLAIAYLLMDNLEGATQCITTILSNDQTNNNNNNKTKITLLQVYIELRQGNVANALSILARERPLPIQHSLQQQQQQQAAQQAAQAQAQQQQQE
ncbi:hypothetical protein SAMD00019534_005570 [Acytostelium subglobosum LB1]|uniref:hypothetical protein n=1 Tax=Acytostelium subglobosum LB1 TaxID=1410327 RepID=UPI0006448B1D|nr:hypothetical protein SAMD00019534_005570 [Acytostelium subglobosum LB1]GAM17382.1 hypothetical protein SAMD00019534_005570 [Acytostelium subglobosum LB1]|eukprot:XP_012759444.1 hypothetical protein SAMD00019534_005570 [Acytostelium subglobosum LB1]